MSKWVVLPVCLSESGMYMKLSRKQVFLASNLFVSNPLCNLTEQRNLSTLL